METRGWLTHPRRSSAPERIGGNAWKYQARTYRHFGWDNGHPAGKYAGRVYGFGAARPRSCSGSWDAEVNRLLDLDMRREVSLCLVPIGHTSESSLAGPRETLRLLA